MNVFDIDGVLADVRHRLHLIEQRPKLWDAFFEAAVDDEPLPQAHEVVLAAAQRGDVCYLTGRPERYRKLTRTWLDIHGFPAATLHMRPTGDRRAGADYKSDVLSLLGGPTRITCVHDDDIAVVTRLQGLGYTVEHVRWMTVDRDSQGTLFEVQENLGLT